MNIKVFRDDEAGIDPVFIKRMYNIYLVLFILAIFFLLICIILGDFKLQVITLLYSLLLGIMYNKYDLLRYSL